MKLFFLTVSLVLSTGIASANCDSFFQDAQGASGSAIPKLDQYGRISSIVMYGEEAFIAPSRSLISSARTGAELRAKRAFVEWFSGENFSAETEAKKMVEVIQLTNERGQSEALAAEISMTLESMQTNTGATISGIVKLDECVDTEQQFIVVEMGWKPDFSNTTKIIEGKSDLSVGNGPVRSDINPATSYRIRSKIKDEF